MARRPISDLWSQREQLFPNVLGVGALFSGAALVVHILTGFSLRYGLALTASTLACGMLAVWLRLAPGKRRQLLWMVGIGAGSGVLATVTYDATKFVLSQLDPSPYDPFALTHTFGVLFVGASAPQALIYASGIGFHVLNGISFAIAFCFLFGRRGILAGVAWGVFLELFQLTLYPGWLDIRFYREFAAIGSLSHLVYGAVLGTCCRAGLRQLTRRYGASTRMTS
jgi:hypothetical protein